MKKYFNECDFKNRLNVLSEVAMGKQLQEYAIADANTQYKYTAADRAMSENIKEQIKKMTSAVKNIVRSQNELNPVWIKLIYFKIVIFIWRMGMPHLNNKLSIAS